MNVKNRFLIIEFSFFFSIVPGSVLLKKPLIAFSSLNKH